VGTDCAGSSTVVSDEASPETLLDNGILLQEVWQQRSIPAAVTDQPASGCTLGPASPVEGAVVRILTVPARTSDRPPAPALHSDPSLHVITMLEGELDIVLEVGRVTLHSGESIVLRDSMHDLDNRRETPARFVYTSFPLRGGPSGR
jgi:hypothetical protein